MTASERKRMLVSIFDGVTATARVVPRTNLVAHRDIPAAGISIALERHQLQSVLDDWVISRLDGCAINST
jgi:hypothetical protein